MITLALTLLAFGLIGLALWDQFWTTFGEGGGPVTRRLAGAVWRLARTVHRRADSGRLLSAAGGLATIATVMCWTTLLWLGWTLLFWAAGSGVVDAAAGEPASVWDRVYFAGYTISTLGIGDVQPRGALARVLTALASLIGVMQLSLAMAYLVPVVTAAKSKRRVAAEISAVGASSADILLNAWNGHRFARLDESLASLTPSLVQLAQSYMAYPVLPYFHSRHRSEAIGLRLATLDEALTLFSCAVNRDALGQSPLAGSAFYGLRRGVTTMLDTLETASYRDDPGVPPPPSLRPLREAGVPVVSDQTFAERLYDLDERRRSLAVLVAMDGWAWDDLEAEGAGGAHDRTPLHELEAI